MSLYISSTGPINPHSPALISPRIIHLDCHVGLFNNLQQSAVLASVWMQQGTLETWERGTEGGEEQEEEEEERERWMKRTGG